MEKRLFAAVTISIAFLFLWTAVAPQLFPELAKKKNVEGTQTTSSSTAETGASTAKPDTALQQTSSTASAVPAAEMTTDVVAPAREIRTVVDHPNYRAVFSNVGAVLVSFELKRYNEKRGLVELVKPRLNGRSDYPFSLESSDRAWSADINKRFFHLSERRQGTSKILTYEAADRNGFRVRKQFSLGPEYLFAFRSEVARPQLSYRIAIGPGIHAGGAQASDSQFLRTGNGVFQVAGDYDCIRREKAPKFQIISNPDFVGIEDNYFVTLMKSKQSTAATFKAVDFPAVSKDEPARREMYVALNGVNGVVDGTAFIGPKETTLLDEYGFGKVVSFGFFGPIARVLLVGLNWVNEYTHNYGWAIVILTIIIKILLFPLQFKSIVSMKKMQKVQPKMNAIKEKYRKAKTDPDQRQKMNVEMMKLYQQEGISPMSGCLPILLQLPILWAFYELLSQAIALRGAPWILWITDLSQKDVYYITPILMTATMFIQQWITPSAMDPVQKKVLMVMPLVFGWIFKEFPSGLVLYWLVQNVLTIAQQLIMNRFWKD